MQSGQEELAPSPLSYSATVFHSGLTAQLNFLCPSSKVVDTINPASIPGKRQREVF